MTITKGAVILKMLNTPAGDKGSIENGGDYVFDEAVLELAQSARYRQAEELAIALLVG